MHYKPKEQKNNLYFIVFVTFDRNQWCNLIPSRKDPDPIKKIYHNLF